MKKHPFSFTWLGIEPRSADPAGRGIGSARSDRKTVVWLLGLTGLTAAVFWLPPSGRGAAADGLPVVPAMISAPGPPASASSAVFSISESAAHSDAASGSERGTAMVSGALQNPVPGGGAGAAAHISAISNTASTAAHGAADPDLADEPFPVYVCGAVRHPRVLQVSAGMVLDDLVRQCGGLTETADAAAVNLAMAVTPNSRIYIPSVGEAPQTGIPADSGRAAEAAVRPAGPEAGVNLNTADMHQLCSLPGVGERTAERILADRARNGPFAAVEDLMRVPGIKAGKLESLRPLVFVN